MLGNIPNEQIKQFDLWNIRKQEVHLRTKSPRLVERQIWWCFLGCNVGSEEDGKHEHFERPVIIFRIFSENTFWAIPLTTKKWPDESRIHYTFECNGIVRAAEIHQMRLLSSRRLDRYIDTVSFQDFQRIRKYVSDLV